LAQSTDCSLTGAPRPHGRHRGARADSPGTVRAADLIERLALRLRHRRPRGVYRTRERFVGLSGYDFEPHYVEQDGLRMHYVDEGSGDPVLLLHGEPTWAFLYRKMIPTIAEAARAVAPDYFGFGRSDKPTRIEDYSYDFHFASIERFADDLDLHDATVVVQDWGGPIGLRLAVERPDRVTRLVILNTGIGAGRTPSEEWLRFRELVRRVGTDLVPAAHQDLGRHRACGRGCRGLQRPVPDAGVEGRRARVSRARPDRGRPSERREDDGGTSCARTMGAPGTRPLLRLRPDLLDGCGRAHGGEDPGRRPGGDDHGRRSLPAGGRRGDRGQIVFLSER
jgi:pimeloyl-ACP methyl ester carboxylesterase